jgi:hypothetical protein
LFYQNQYIIITLYGDARLKGCDQMDYLYFPENKLEYIPGFFWLVVAFFIAVLAFRFIKRVSEKELKKAKQMEEELLKQEKQRKNPIDR